MTSSIHVIPSEVVLLWLMYLDIQTLVRCSHVCRRWRELAHTSPVFWRDITVHPFTTAYVALFLARVDICATPGLSIGIHDPMDQCALYAEVLLPCVARNMRRIRKLHITYPYEVTEQLATTLDSAAPILERLTLACHGLPDRVVDPVIPRATFSEVCPRLRSLQLIHVDLPNHVVPAFANIEDVALGGAWITHIPPTLFECLPRLKKLSINAVDIVRLSDCKLPPIPASIESVNVCLSHDGCAAFLHWIGASHPNLVMQEPGSPNVAQALQHLSGPLQLNMWRKDTGNLLMQYVAPGKIRAFLHHGSDFMLRWPSDAYFATQFANRITVLRISTALLATLTAVPSLRACRTLVLHVTRKQDQLRLPVSASLHLPALTTICVHTGYYEADLLSGGDLVEALDALLTAPTSRPLLHVAGYPGVSDEDALLARYDLEVVCQHREHCAQCGEHIPAPLPIGSWERREFEFSESFRYDPAMVDVLSKAGFTIC